MIGTSLTGPQKDDITRAFTKVYNEDVWQRRDTSGPGSSVQHTGGYRTFLRRVLKSYNIRKVIDVGCGLWEHLGNVDWSGVDYLGIDPVPSVIERNRKLNLPQNHKFQCGLLDDVTDLQSFDLAIVKDVLQHLPIKTIDHMLRQLKVVKFLLITNDVCHDANADCALGGFRKINLELPPFNLSPDAKVDFQSCPFVKRTLLIQNAVGDAAPTLNMSSSSSVA